MPVTIKPSQFKYKDPSTSQYVSVAAVADLSNIPVASTSTFGLLKTGYSTSGLQRDNDGYLKIYPAPSADIKGGTEAYRPIVPYHQHESIFYGLAKAAGDTTQALSSNAVGTYTNDAKISIQAMFGLDDKYVVQTKPRMTGRIIMGLYNSESTIANTMSQHCLAFGYYPTVHGEFGIALGYNSGAMAPFSMAGGSSATYGVYSLSFGNGTVSTYEGQATFGRYNVDETVSIPNWESETSYQIGDIVRYNSYVLKCKEANSNSTAPLVSQWDQEYGNLFVIGNGTSTTAGETSNALTLHHTGRLSIKDYIYVGANADGSGGIRLPHDIQINGTSIVSNGVATIPIASDSTFGVIKTREYTDGFKFDSNNNLQLAGPSDTQIKAGETNYRAITPYIQHTSVFYGLAKAAGDSTQSASSNTIGVYTDNAKIAIQKMIGNYEPDYVLVNDITLTEETTLDLTMTDDNVAYNFRNVYIYIYYPADTTSVANGYDRYRFYDSSNNFIVAETRKYTSKTLNNFKHIHLKRKANMALVQYTWQANTGDSGTWNIKAYPDGIRFGMGNITRIMMPDADAEPAGARIRIFAQWAY